MSIDDRCWCCSMSKCFLLDEGVKRVEPGDVAVNDAISELLNAVPLSVPESACNTVAWDSFHIPSE